MTTDDDAERERRVLFSWASEPGDDVTARMIARYGTAATVEAITADAPPTIGRRQVDRADAEQWQQRLAARVNARRPDAVIDACDRQGIKVIIPGDPDWPSGLDALPNPPVVIYAKGKSDVLARPLDARVTIIGARAVTQYGDFIAKEAADQLAADGFSIVTGGAYGIDRAAMEAALAAGGVGITILAGGLDRIYPAGNEHLIESSTESGAVISELPPGMPPTKWRFTQRARLLAATGAATVIVEAGARSGSLLAASYATRLGRPVAAFPGPVTSPLSAGTHRLIQQGVARLVTQAEDIRQLIDRDPAQPPEPPAAGAARVATAAPSERRRSLADFAEHTVAQAASTPTGVAI